MFYPIYRQHCHPQIPLSVWEFLIGDLRLGRKYAVLAKGFAAERFVRRCLQQVRLVVLLESNAEAGLHLQQELEAFDNLAILQGDLGNIELDDDTIDFFVALQPQIDELDTETARNELKRVLRLNSFAVFIGHNLLPEASPFAQAYVQFLKRYNKLQTDEYGKALSAETWSHFFGETPQIRRFPNQLRLDFEGLKGYYLSAPGAFTEQDPEQELALKALRLLFAEFKQSDGMVALDFETSVLYGLLNKYVPAISLRKSLFFNLLRPFAFGFYVLVKLNIYFWKFLYSLKDLRKRRR